MKLNKSILFIFPALLISLNLNAQSNNETGYLNNNNILSSFANELSINLSKELARSEKEKLENFKKSINDQLETSKLEQVVYFKTADNNLNEKTLNYINNVILSLNDYKNLDYYLIGHADIRGNTEYNLGLAQQRIDSMKNILLNLDIPEENIGTENKGTQESKPRSNVEDYFYDRKVQMIIKKK